MLKLIVKNLYFYCIIEIIKLHFMNMGMICLENILGEKISPIEVDAVLLTHTDVSEAVAFGVPDDKYGEEVSE